jgi:hypothetical protein
MSSPVDRRKVWMVRNDKTHRAAEVVQLDGPDGPYWQIRIYGRAYDYTDSRQAFQDAWRMTKNME